MIFSVSGVCCWYLICRGRRTIKIHARITVNRKPIHCKFFLSLLGATAVSYHHYYVSSSVIELPLSDAVFRFVTEQIPNRIEVYASMCHSLFSVFTSIRYEKNQSILNSTCWILLVSRASVFSLVLIVNEFQDGGWSGRTIRNRTDCRQTLSKWSSRVSDQMARISR